MAGPLGGGGVTTLVEAASRVAATPLDGLRALARLLRSLALVTLAAVLLAGAYVTWVRDLPIFAVSSVEIAGTEDGLIISTLTGLSREMTTLHIEQDRLDEVAAHFPVISSIEADPSFPSGLELTVATHEPVAIAQLGSRTVPVAADGTLLAGVKVTDRVPTLRAEASAGVLSGDAASQVRVVGAAPGPLHELIRSVATDPEHGILIGMKGGVELRFGTAAAADRKWAAAAAVLADDQLSGLTYIDVSAPERPAVGGAVGGPPIEVAVEVAPPESAAAEPVDPALVPGSETAPSPSADPALETVPETPVPVSPDVP